MRVNYPSQSIDLLTSRANLSEVMECPRCGFSQPDDRFCANCGLNVAAYLARPKPFAKKLLSHPLTYLVAAVLLGYGLVTWVKMNPISSASKGNAVESTKPVSITKNENSNLASGPDEERPPAQELVALNEENPVKKSKQEVPTAALAAATGSGKEEAKVELKPINQLDLQFYEVARDSFQALTGEGKSADHSGWRTLVIAKEKLAPILNQGRRLPGGRSLNSQTNAMNQVQFALTAGDVPFGLFLYFSIAKNDAGNLDLEISAQLDLKHDATNETHLKSDLNQSVSSAQMLVVSGWLPHKSLMDAYPSLAQTPLTAIQSPDYLEGQSEVLFVVEPK